MNNIINSISRSVFSTNIADIPLQELRQLAHTHPYSAALQLLYSQKLKEENNEDFGVQWQKTMLYFNDPFFLKQVARFDGSKNTLIPTQSHAEPDTITADTKAQPTLNDATPLKIPGLKIEPIDPEKNLPGFTPYFTIDYFTSQGIRLSDTVGAGDRLGAQLKTFTSWLKEMRRLPEAEAASRVSVFEQKNVEKMAAHSLSGENAITVAMAQVWQQQGNIQKAIEVYKKLSLQNPAKSAFFAAKIEHLKKQL